MFYINTASLSYSDSERRTNNTDLTSETHNSFSYAFSQIQKWSEQCTEVNAVGLYS